MKQTAVDWLINELKSLGIYSSTLKEKCESAKQIEKEQIIDAVVDTQCQKDMADKKYTEDDLMSAFNVGINNDYGNGLSFDTWLNSLNKQD